MSALISTPQKVLGGFDPFLFLSSSENVTKSGHLFIPGFLFWALLASRHKGCLKTNATNKSLAPMPADGKSCDDARAR